MGKYCGAWLEGVIVVIGREGGGFCSTWREGQF